MAYDAQGRPLTVLTGFDNALSSDPATSLSTEYSYLPVDASDNGTRDDLLRNSSGGGRGRARLAEFEKAMTADGAEAFAAFLNRASDADIKRVVDRLNTAAELDLGTRWWDPGR